VSENKNQSRQSSRKPQGPKGPINLGHSAYAGKGYTVHSETPNPKPPQRGSGTAKPQPSSGSTPSQQGSTQADSGKNNQGEKR
jgi:hypothetical protein